MGLKSSAAADAAALREENEHMRSEFEAHLRSLHAEYAAKMSDEITQATRDIVQQSNSAIALEREATGKVRRDIEQYVSVAGEAEEQLRNLQATLDEANRRHAEDVRVLEADRLFQVARVNELGKALDEVAVNAGVVTELQSQLETARAEQAKSQEKVAAAESQMEKYKIAQKTFDERARQEMMPGDYWNSRFGKHNPHNGKWRTS